MKKMICLLLLLLIPIKAQALEKLNENNRKYRFYYIEKEYSEKFFEKGKNDKAYPNMGTAWYYDEKIHVSKNKPTGEKLIVEEVPVLKYQEHKKIRYLILDQVQSRTKVNLTELEVFAKENKISYGITCDICSSDFYEKIKNNTVDYEYNYVPNNAKIVVDLQKEYFPEDITLKLHIFGVAGKSMKFRFTANNTAEINDIYFTHIIEKVEDSYLQIIVDLKSLDHEERLEEQVLEIKGENEIENAKIIEKHTEYHYKNKFYQYYREIKHYIDGYYKDLPGLLKDENDYIEEKEENTVVVPTETDQKEYETIVEYVEKEVPVKITKVKEIPIVVEKVKIQDHSVEKEVPVEKLIEKNTTIEKSKNYPLQYIVYFVSAIFLKKMSIFSE